MTDNRFVIAVINELLALEQRRLPHRLIESTVFISASSVDEVALVGRMAEDSKAHCANLVRLVRALGGVPGPRVGDMRSADLHFMELQLAIPRLVQDQQLIIQRYRRAAELAGSAPKAAEVIQSILARHEHDLSLLQVHTGAEAQAADSSA